MTIRAFVDHGYSDPLTFCIQLLNGPEFTIETLKKFGQYKASKETLAYEVAEYIARNRIDKSDFLLEYVQQPRQWFTFKAGTYNNIPTLDDPAELLTEFGKDQWYGPLHSTKFNSDHYLRIFSFENFDHLESPTGTKIIKSRIRWLLVASVNSSYLSFSWNGFTLNAKDKIKSRFQFPFWQYLPSAINEFEDLIDGEYEYPLFHELVLETLWDRYVDNPNYNWHHLAVRAEASGVALNARSAGVADIDVRGLLALANKLAVSVVNELLTAKFKKDHPQMVLKLYQKGQAEIVKAVEINILKTLIHNWGTKSYEFKLDSGKNRLFRSHCYFGLKPHGTTQDCFPHFKSNQHYGGSGKALNFLLDEIGILK